MTENYLASLAILRTRTENTDTPFMLARQKYFALS